MDAPPRTRHGRSGWTGPDLVCQWVPTDTNTCPQQAFMHMAAMHRTQALAETLGRVLDTYGT